jgi:hypothetical protein
MNKKTPLVSVIILNWKTILRERNKRKNEKKRILRMMKKEQLFFS